MRDHVRTCFNRIKHQVFLPGVDEIIREEAAKLNIAIVGDFEINPIPVTKKPSYDELWKFYEEHKKDE